LEGRTIELGSGSPYLPILGAVVGADPHFTMLTGNNVLDPERRDWEVLLPEQTIFTAIVSPLTDKVAERRIHQLGGRLAKMARAFACKRPIRSIAST
jgi:hypothetical protein